MSSAQETIYLVGLFPAAVVFFLIWLFLPAVCDDHYLFLLGRFDWVVFVVACFVWPLVLAYFLCWLVYTLLRVMVMARKSASNSQS